MDIRKVAGQPDTNNAEIAAVVAPRPLLIISDGDDWTKHFPEEDFPSIQHIYGLFGADEKVGNRHFPNGKHDYGPEYRQLAYQFFAKAFRMSPPPKQEAVYIESQNDQAVSNWIQLPAAFPVKNEESSVNLFERTWLGVRTASGYAKSVMMQVMSFF